MAKRKTIVFETFTSLDELNAYMESNKELFEQHKKTISVTISYTINRWILEALA